MTREQRLEMIDQLRLDIAENLEELAAREARTAAGLDPPEWQVPEHHETRQQQKTEVIYKDFRGEQSALPPEPVKQATVYMDDATQRAWDAWYDERLIKSFEDDIMPAIGRFVRKYFAQKQDETKHQIKSVTADAFAELEARIAALEDKDAGYRG
jgi:hypothetical protein